MLCRLDGILMTRINIREILADPWLKRCLMVRCIIATQAREGIVTTKAQAEAAYDKVAGNKKS